MFDNFDLGDYMEMADDDIEYVWGLEYEYFNLLTELCEKIEAADNNPRSGIIVDTSE